MTLRRHGWRVGWVAVALLAVIAPGARAVEHVTLANGFELDCLRREVVGDRIRLYFVGAPGAALNYMEVAASAVVKVEAIVEPVKLLGVPPIAKGAMDGARSSVGARAQPTAGELTEMLARAGAQHHIDAELLASVVHAESAGAVRAVSKTGARGLMQLMPGTAAVLGVRDAFAADQNVEGGTKYLDQLLTRYHDDMALALAAYNAGPGAVDRYHGVPPFRETREYVARVIREFNRRKTEVGKQKTTLLAQGK